MIFRSDTGPVNEDVARELACEIYGFRRQTDVATSIKEALFHHWEALKLSNQQLQEDFPGLNGINHLCDLIKVVKTETEKPINDLHGHLVTDPVPIAWISTNTSEAAIINALQFVLHLWLFADPSFQDKSITLKQAVHKSLNSIKVPSDKRLWEDFSAHTLKKVSGLKFIPTNNFVEHLTFASSCEIKFFCHTRILRRYAETFTLESKWYPEGLLNDFDRTMNLLWPLEQPKVSRRVRRLQKKLHADLEASMGQVNKFDLRTYPFFGDRLAKIQERREAEEQRRSNQIAFKFAIWGILLTAFFGLVSAVTSLVSMWTGLKQVDAVK